VLTVHLGRIEERDPPLEGRVRMMWIISGRVGIVVWYVRLMFWTPRPMLETSSDPSRRCAIAPGAGCPPAARG
jgi:hypothetical protein